MAQTLETLTRRTGTLSSIRGIVHVMKTLSVINAAPYDRAVQSIAAYQDTVQAGFRAFFARTGQPDPPSGPATTHVALVFGTDHGLCGNYNEVVAEAVRAHLSDMRAACPDIRVLCVGAQMQDALYGVGLASDVLLMAPASVDGIGRLAGEIVIQVEATRPGGALGDLSVTLCHMRRARHGRLAPRLHPLLPLRRDSFADPGRPAWVSRSLPDFSMQPQTLLAALIRSHIFASVFHAAAEALVTENDARLARMQQAERLIDERLDELLAQTRSVRQSEITAEMLDVIIGAGLLDRKPGVE